MVIEITGDDRSSSVFQHEWISIRAAIEKTKASQPTSELGRFIRERDLYFAETYVGYEWGVATPPRGRCVPILRMTVFFGTSIKPSALNSNSLDAIMIF